jgi:hypothetical protein
MDNEFFKMLFIIILEAVVIYFLFMRLRKVNKLLKGYYDQKNNFDEILNQNKDLNSMIKIKNAQIESLTNALNKKAKENYEDTVSTQINLAEEAGFKKVK